MKLSMWVLADWLIGYDATVMITDGPMMLEGVRLLSGAHSDDRRIVYLDYAAISDISSRPGIFCVHGRDLIFLKTDDIDSVLNDILAAFDFFDSWENDIRRLIHEEGTLQDILDYSNGVFLQPMLLLDPDDEIVASIGQADHDDRLETWRRLEHGSALDEVAVTDEACASDVREASGEDDAPYNGRSRVSGILQKMICIDGENTYRLAMVTKPDGATDGQIQLLEHLGGFIEDWLIANRGRSGDEDITDILAKLLDDPAHHIEEARIRLRSVGWADSLEKVAIVMHGAGTDTDQLTSILSSVERRLPRCCSAQHDDAIVTLADLAITSQQELGHGLSPLLARFELTAAMSFPFSDLSQTTEHIRQGRFALHVLDIPSGSLCRCEDHALPFIIDTISSGADLSYLHPAIPALHEYDQARGGELCETLFAYLLNHQSLVKTSEALCIHRNSLVYRLRRIHELVGVDLEDADTTLHLLLSLCVLDGNLRRNSSDGSGLLHGSTM